MFAALVILVMASCAQEKTTSTQIMDKFDEFKKKEKFGPEPGYTGVADLAMRSALTEKINAATDDFKKLSETGKAADKDYQDKIRDGLQRFSDVYVDLDTEDRERVCEYFEELMDLVGLQSSGGHLNQFMYGFDPADRQQG